jgi:hypothetical protein
MDKIDILTAHIFLFILLLLTLVLASMVEKNGKIRVETERETESILFHGQHSLRSSMFQEGGVNSII